MKKLLMTLCAITALSTMDARAPNTVNVDNNGIVSRGASKLAVKNLGVKDSTYISRKPNRIEITDTDPRKLM